MGDIKYQNDIELGVMSTSPPVRDMDTGVALEDQEAGLPSFRLGVSKQEDDPAYPTNDPTGDTTQSEAAGLMKFDDQYRRRLREGITSLAAHHHLVVNETSRTVPAIAARLIPFVGGRVAPARHWEFKVPHADSFVYDAHEDTHEGPDTDVGASGHPSADAGGSVSMYALQKTFGDCRPIDIRFNDRSGRLLFRVTRESSFMRLSYPLVHPLHKYLQGARAVVTGHDGRLIGTMVSMPPSLWPLVEKPWRMVLCGLFFTALLVFLKLVFLTKMSVNYFINLGMIFTACFAALGFIHGLYTVTMAGYQKTIFDSKGHEVGRVCKKARPFYYLPFCGLLASAPYDVVVVDSGSCQIGRVFHGRATVGAAVLPRGLPMDGSLLVKMSKTGSGATVETRALVLAACMLRSYSQDYPLPLYHLGWLLPPLCLCFL